MKRREFVLGVGGAAAIWAATAWAQQHAMKRVGVLYGANENDPEFRARIAAFLETFATLGWIDGRNVHIDRRWGTGTDIIQKNAQELMALAPDVVLANAPPAVLAVRKISATVPIVFIAVTDPVVLGLVQSLARPGGNSTGFTSAEVALSAKWLELLMEMAPTVRRVGVLAPPANLGAEAQIAVIQKAAPSFKVEVSRIGVSEPAEIEGGIKALSDSASAGLIVSRTAETISIRETIAALAVRYRLPAVYPYSTNVASGGLASYGPDERDSLRKAAVYVDRILKGEQPADLPVQVPTAYELAINLSAAKAIGLTLPPSLVARADQVIE